MASNKRTTNEERTDRNPDGKFKPGVAPNPTGKGGFQERPEDRSNGRWSKEGSISYNYNKIMRMSDDELEAFKPSTQAEKIALMRVNQAAEKLGLADAKELADRTEGKAPQFFGLGGQEDYEQIFVQFIGKDHDEDTDTD